MTMLNWARRLQQLPNAPVLQLGNPPVESPEFLTPEGFCKYFGVFESFDAARAWLPRNDGFDHAALAQGYDEHVRHVFAYDYPAMCGFSDALAMACRKLLDIGGAYGVHYYAYRRYIEMPDDLIWEVAELPAHDRHRQGICRSEGNRASFHWRCPGGRKARQHLALVRHPPVHGRRSNQVACSGCPERDRLTSF